MSNVFYVKWKCANPACGKEEKLPPYLAKRKYCDRDCKAAHYLAKQKKIPCPICGVLFHPKDKGHRMNKTCSRRCGGILGAKTAWATRRKRYPQTQGYCHVDIRTERKQREKLTKLAKKASDEYVEGNIFHITEEDDEFDQYPA